MVYFYFYLFCIRFELAIVFLDSDIFRSEEWWVAFEVGGYAAKNVATFLWFPLLSFSLYSLDARRDHSNLLDFTTAKTNYHIKSRSTELTQALACACASSAIISSANKFKASSSAAVNCESSAEVPESERVVLGLEE